MRSSPIQRAALIATCVSLLLGGAACSSSDSGESPGESKPALGAACESASECGGELECHSDTTDYIANGQCAKPCDTGDACKSAFGESSFCIGAGICVMGCEQDSDCPEKTLCKNGWCKRTGPGSGNPYCAEAPTPCSLLSESQCWSVLGCHDSGYCSGVPSSCSSQSYQFECEDLKGCYWSSSSKSCTGVAYSCAGTTSYACTDQKGCVWSAACSGTPYECDGQSTYSLCTSTPGCTWEYE